MRNPLITLNGKTYQTIGDLHLGRKFNSRLDRRGQYEDRQYYEFEQLMNVRADYTVLMGDVFDKRRVDEVDILRTFEVISEGVFSGRNLIILRGNHDDTKNVREKSSFDILTALCLDIAEIQIVKDTLQLEKVAFCGWCFDKTLTEQIMSGTVKEVEHIFTHRDTVDYGSNASNIIDFDFLARNGIKTVINGHEHKPSRKTIAGIEYIGTGSLLPYSHAEHSDEEKGDVYITFKNLEDLKKAIEDGSLLEKHVRLYVEDPSLVPEFDSLSIQINKVNVLEEVEVVQIEEYSLKGLFKATAMENKMETEQAVMLWNEIVAAGGEE